MAPRTSTVSTADWISVNDAHTDGFVIYLPCFGHRRWGPQQCGGSFLASTRFTRWQPNYLSADEAYLSIYRNGSCHRYCGTWEYSICIIYTRYQVTNLMIGITLAGYGSKMLKDWLAIHVLLHPAVQVKLWRTVLSGNVGSWDLDFTSRSVLSWLDIDQSTRLAGWLVTG